MRKLVTRPISSPSLRNPKRTRLRANQNRFRIEALESRLALATVLATDFSSNGKMDDSSREFVITFDSNMLNADVPANYQLRAASFDGRLLDSDAFINPFYATVRGKQVILQFPNLFEDTYRLTILDNLTDEFFSPLDGDANGTPGGHWKGDFVVNIRDHNLEPLSIANPSSPYGGPTRSETVRSMSSDGRYVTFVSAASNLVPGDVNGRDDVFWKDMVSGEIRLASTSPRNVQANNEMIYASISRNGRFVVMLGYADNLRTGISEASNGFNIYVKDMQSGNVQLANTNNLGGRINPSLEKPMISEDGRYVMFASWENGLALGDSNNTHDIFRKDLSDGSLALVSTDQDNQIGNGASSSPYMSNDGRFVAFISSSSNWDARDNNFNQDAFVKDLFTGQLRLASVNGFNEIGNGGTYDVAVSDDGNRVSFSSSSNNLSPNDTNFNEDMFVRDFFLGTTELQSYDRNGQPDSTFFSAFDSTGRYILFASPSTKILPSVDTQGVQFFVRDTFLNTVALASVPASGVPATSSFLYNSQASLSENGLYAQFETYSALVPEQSGILALRKNLGTGALDVVNTRAFFLPSITSAAETSEVAISRSGRQTLLTTKAGNFGPGFPDGNDRIYLQNAVTTLVTEGMGGAPANGRSQQGTFSGNERFVAFASQANNLVADDTNGTSDVFLRDLSSGTITRISTLSSGSQWVGWHDTPQLNFDGNLLVLVSNSAGVPADTNGQNDVYSKNLFTGELQLESIGGGPSGASNGTSQWPSISDDGRFLAFASTATNLIDGVIDTNFTWDVFVKDRQTGVIFLVSSAISSSGPGVTGSGGSYQPTISSDGRYVGFMSDAQNLVPGDDNGTSDYFIKDMFTGTIVMASSKTDGTPTDRGAFDGSLSKDGLVVTFVSSSTNFDAVSIPSRDHIYTKNLVSGKVTRITPIPETTILPTAFSPRLNEDGSRVVFLMDDAFLMDGDYNGITDAFIADVDSPSTPSLATPSLSTFDIDVKGYGTGAILEGPLDTFDEYGKFKVNLFDYRSEMVSRDGLGGQEIELDQADLVSFLVNREVYAPNTGAYDFVRMVDTFQNVSGTTLNLNVDYLGNLGSNDQTQVFATSDGDLSIESTDLWIATDDANPDGGKGAIVHLFHSPGGIAPNLALIEDNLSWSYETLMAAGQTVRLAHFALVGQKRSDVLAAISTFTDNGSIQPDAIFGLQPEEVNTLINFPLTFGLLSLTSNLAAVREDAGTNAAILTLTRTGNVSSALTVQLQTSDSSEATVPATLTFPPNVISAQFALNAVDDTLLDGLQTVQITASTAGYTSGTLNIDVLDAENLRITPSTTVTKENDGPNAIPLRIERLNTDLSLPLQVNLTSSDTSEGTVPAQVTIPANATFVMTFMNAQDDTVLDGTQFLNLQATALGYDPANQAISVQDAEQLTFQWDRPSIKENAGANAATITVTRSNTDRALPLTVNLVNGDSTELSIPATLTIPANAASGQVTVTAVDDSLLDGTQSVVVAAFQAGYDSGFANILVEDSEALIMTATQVSFREDSAAGSSQVTITRANTDIDLPLTISLNNPDPTELAAPTQVTILAGTPSVTFSVNAVDDTLLDGPQIVRLAAASTGYEFGIIDLTVLDAESLSIAFDRASIREDAGSNAAFLTISRSNTDRSAPLTVTLTNPDASELAVPATATIPINAASIQIPVSAIDDNLLDGTQTVLVRATTSGYFDGTASLNVDDAESLSVTASPAQFAENAGSNASLITVTRSNTDTSTSLLVQLTSSDTSELTVPATILIPAGQMSASVSADAVDDSLPDGSQTAQVRATADGYLLGSTDITVLDFEPLILILSPNPIRESDGNNATILTITRPSSVGSLPVTITNSLPGRISVAASTTIAAGQLSRQISIRAIDDSLLNGSGLATLTASANGIADGTISLQIEDDERLTLTLDRTSVTENTGANTAILNVRRSNTDNTQVLTVNLSSNRPDQLSVPATATIPAGVQSVNVLVSAIDDSLLDGTQTVTLNAAHPAYFAGTASLDVSDFEQILLSMSESSFAENAGNNAATLTVRRSNTDTQSSLLVTLVNPDTSELSIPASVTIPANQDSITIPIDAVDDTLLDGSQSVSLSASAVGYAATTPLVVTVTDAEALALTLSSTTIAENAGSSATSLTVRRLNSNINASVVIPLQVDIAGQVQIPASITIPANQSQATVSLNAIDNTLLDGSRTITISALGGGYATATTPLTILDHETLSTSLTASSISESNGQTQLTVTRSNTDRSQPLIVQFTNGDASEISIPTSVTIAAGDASASVTLTSIDDTLLDGSQVVSLTATATGYVTGSSTIAVQDSETLSLSLDRTTFREDAGLAAVQVTATRSNTDQSNPVTIALQLSTTGLATVPASVVIPANQPSVQFTLNAIDNVLLQGDQTFTLTATSNGYTSGTATLVSQDAETLIPQFSVSTVSEGGNAITLTVTRSNTNRQVPVSVLLTNSHPAELQIPTSITIPSGQASITVPISVLDDTLLDGDQIVTLQAAAEGYLAGSTGVVVTDRESLILTLPTSSFMESAGPDAAMLRLERSNTDLGSELIVQLQSNDPTEATLPNSVTIPVGTKFILVPLSILDDQLLDGTQSVTLQATAAGYQTGTVPLQILDHETLSASFSVSTIAENAGNDALQLVVIRSNTDRSQPLVVQISDLDPSELALPSSFTIPANADRVVLPIDVVDDSLLDGTQNLQFQFAANGYIGADAALSITDAETLSATLNVNQVSEDAGSNAASLTISRSNTDRTLPLTVQLTHTLGSHITLPPSTTIPAGQASITVPVPIVDNALLDGNRIGTITASASGYQSSNASLTISDAETLTLQLSGNEMSEKDGQLVGIVRRSNTDLNAPLTVSLSATPSGRLNLPASVTIPAQQASFSFFVNAIDDRVLQGTTSVSITVVANGYTSGSNTLNLLDHEILSLTSTVVQVAENGGATRLRVERGDVDSVGPLTVNLAANPSGLVTLPASVTIPAGATGIDVPLTAIDDFLFDGDQTVDLSVSASGMVGAGLEIDILDEETRKPGTNPLNPLDVNVDNRINPLDALLILNRLNISDSGPIPLTEFGRYYDTSGDLRVTPLDALRVLNYLNAGRPASGEGEDAVENAIEADQPNTWANPEDIDAAFAFPDWWKRKSAFR